MSGVMAIDAHIHMDLYEEEEQYRMLEELPRCGVEGVVAVSMNLASCERNLALARAFPGQVIPAFGYHPEQPVPSAAEADALIDWMRIHREAMAAIGEVGLPTFLRMEAEEQGRTFAMEPYVQLLERFIRFAGEWSLPIVLHAVQEEAILACELLEKHGVADAHFHWFKGPPEAVSRVLKGGYHISITPEIAYDGETRELARLFPLERLMAETDGPWPFEGPYEGRRTEPSMALDVIRGIAQAKGLGEEETARAIRRNTRRFYRLDSANRTTTRP